MNLSNEGRTFEQYLAETSMEEIQELLRKCRKIDFPVPRNVASMAYVARDSPSLSLYLQMQKSLADELDHCCEVLLNDRKITGFLQGCHVVNTTMMASAVLVHSWKCKVPPSQMFSTLESIPHGERLSKLPYRDIRPFSIAGIPITQTDLHTLEPSQWVNDQVSVLLFENRIHF